MIETVNSRSVEIPDSIDSVQFGVIKMTGDESVDFLQRITTNEFTGFNTGSIQKTLLVTDKGRVLDAVWVVHCDEYLLMLTSEGMAGEIITWLDKYIIMEQIELQDVSSIYHVVIHSKNVKDSYQTDYFGVPASFTIILEKSSDQTRHGIPIDHSYETWRINNGIPKTKQEISPEFNPLELNLWDWISFTKGCYIGQEVIARLDTYNKIQRCLCKISSDQSIAVRELLLDSEENEIGIVTSFSFEKTHLIGLAVIKTKAIDEERLVRTKGSGSIVTIEHVFRKLANGTK